MARDDTRRRVRDAWMGRRCMRYRRVRVCRPLVTRSGWEEVAFGQRWMGRGGRPSKREDAYRCDCQDQFSHMYPFF